MATPMDRPLIAELRRVCAGPVLTPRDDGYDAARAVYFTSIDRRPEAIVRVANPADAGRVVVLAHESGRELAVRNGGHSVAGHSVIDGGIVLDLSALRSLEIDVARRVARAGAGLTAGEYTTATGAHGLATGFGDAPSVGIGGITLSGGIGFLHRKTGMTIDSVVSADVVTANGQQVRASEASHPDLFWAIRGGGGNFGVVTRFEYRLHPVDTVVGGMLLLPATAERVVAFLDAAAAAPEALSMIVMVLPAPPMPFIPPEHHGKLIIMATMVYAGDVDAGERVVAPFRALAAPIADMIRPMKYPSIYDGHAGAPHPVAAVIRTRFLDTVDTAAAEAMVTALAEGTAPMRAVQFRPLGGAMGRVPADATAFAHRDRRFMVNVAAMYEDPSQTAEHAAWAAAAAAGLDDGARGVYVAFLGDEGQDRIREAYPGATGRRLAAIKHRYDPDNVFRHNQNITPSPEAPAGTPA
jgi:FAD/FMN-containing dehydrogenase